MNKFVHLHNHTEYSALDGASQIKKLVNKVKKLGQPAIAITDHGNMNGCYKFYTECIKQEIKPILGIEAYLVEKYIKEKTVTRFHITLLAKNNIGWKNLLKLHRISSENFYYKPRIDIEDLIKHKEGLIAMSGCPAGIIPKNILEHNIEKAEYYTKFFKKEFGEDFYIEIMEHGIDFQKELNFNLRKLAKKYKIKTVGTNDGHYISKEDYIYQDYLICDQIKSTVNQPNKFKFDQQEFYIKTREEMPCTEEEKDVTLEIADKCNVEIKFNGFLLPKIEQEESKLAVLISEGMIKRKMPQTEEYLERLRTEYKIIKDANLIGYFLMVQDYLKYSKDNNILTGPGRGSVGGCLLGYIIGIHDIDPIKHKLLFSRFYNAGRAGSLPDIDTDFPEKKIKIIRNYVQKKYGKEKVAHIGTFTYLQKKSSLKLICRVLGVDYQTANYYSSIIEDDKETENIANKNSTFKEIIEKAKQIEGIATYSSIHAAGMILSPVELDNYIPLRVNSENGLYVSSWDMKDVESIGLVKFDFLSLSTLDVIENTLEQINITLEDIPKDDKKTFDLISNTNNVGVFQLSSDGISKVANDMKVESIDDIAAVVALYRPGPINSGLHTRYIKRKNKLEEIEYPHPLLEEDLKDTYGVMIYQEQVIKAVMTLADFSEIEADLLRKAIGKKIPELMAKQQKKFILGAAKKGVNKQVAINIWEEIKEFAEYSFNRSHSVGYGYITYYTAYLKANYPHEFMCSLLNNSFNKSEKLNKYLKECKNLGIEVVPPSVTIGSCDFKVLNKKIVFGLKGISGIGEKTANKIYEKKYNSFEDFCFKFKPSSDIIIALAEAGVFDEFEYNRNEIIQASTTIAETVKNRNKIINPKAISLFEKNPSFNIIKREELPNEILANKEYERLNVYLVYNPLENIDLEYPETLEKNCELFIEGYLSKLEEHTTKSKKTMAFLNVATNLGQIEALMFPKLYQEKRGLIRKNTYIAMLGKWEDKFIIKNIWERKK